MKTLKEKPKKRDIADEPEYYGQFNPRDDTVWWDRTRCFCLNCFHGGNFGENRICPKCKNKTVMMPYEAQPPRKNASKMRWNEFFRKNYQSLIFENYWKMRMKQKKGDGQ